MIYTPEQQRVINSTDKRMLVLAPPGSGKTELLTQKISTFIENGGDPKEVLCLTFTNRAYRNMEERIKTKIGDKASGIFVGNIFRFCSNYLWDNGKVNFSCTVYDEFDTMERLKEIFPLELFLSPRFLNAHQTNVSYAVEKKILIDLLGIERYPTGVLKIYQMEYLYNDFLRIFGKISSQLYAMINNLKPHLYNYLHIPFFDTFTLDNLKLFLENPTLLDTENNPTHLLLAKALEYLDAKREEDFIDYDDVLIRTYLDYSNNKTLKRYSFVEVDEIQDLSPLQIELMKELCANNGTIIFYGDPSQAIFSFNGADLKNIETFAAFCNNNIYHLSTNFRSQPYMVDMLQEYAQKVLKVDERFLPQRKAETAAPKDNNSLIINQYDDIFRSVAERNIPYYNNFDGENLAIILPSNSQADVLYKELEKKEIGAFKLSGKDVFKSDEFKAMRGMLILLTNDCSYTEPSQLLTQAKMSATLRDARNFIKSTKAHGLGFADFMRQDGGSYLTDFCHAYLERDIVVFDTETTGINPLKDDIVQISAVRFRGGEVVGESLNYFLHTDKELPKNLGAIPNPLHIEYPLHEHLPQSEGLQKFFDFAQGAVLVGHNVDFDYHIVDSSFKKYLGRDDFKSYFPLCFDTLRLSRRLYPNAHSYKLVNMVKNLNLEGQNSHRSDEDVLATVNLLKHCYEKATLLLPKQKEFIKTQQLVFQKISSSLMGRCYNYLTGIFFDENPDRLYGFKHVFTTAMYLTYKALYSKEPTENMLRALQFIDADVIEDSWGDGLIEQVNMAAFSLNSFTEADLCSSTVVKERIFISTVHKAKGMEFDNVIVMDVDDNTFPSFQSKSEEAQNEDARKLYVALSRAKKRLCLVYRKRDRNNKELKMSRFIEPIQENFRIFS